MNVFLITSANLVVVILTFISLVEAVPFQNNVSDDGNNNKVARPPLPDRFSRALVSQFDSFKKEHPIQARILELVGNLLMRPASVHSLLQQGQSANGGMVNSNSIPQAEERIMGSRTGDEDEEMLVPEASSYQPTYTAYPNVRRSGRFMFPDEYAEKVKRFEAEQERTLGRSNFNNYHIINNQVRLGRVEAVRKPEVGVGVPFIPRGGGDRSGRKFEPSMADGSSSSISYVHTQESQVAIPAGGDEFEKWRHFGVLPQEHPPRRYQTEEAAQTKNFGVDNDESSKVSSSEWTATTTDTFTKPRNPFEDVRPSLVQFGRPPLQMDSPIPVLRPMYNPLEVEGFNSNNRIARRGKSLNFDVDSQDSEWQLLGTSRQGGESRERFVPSGPVGVGTVQVQPASAFSSKEVDATPKEVPRVSKVMRPSTIRSQPLIVKDARDGRSLKEIEVQGVKIIVGSKTPSFPKDIYMRNNYVRSLATPTTSASDKSNVDISVGSSITTL